MFRFLILLLTTISLAIVPAWGNEKQVDNKKKPIKALLVTGGCCHDYERQKLILTQGISARADVEWTIVHQGGSTTNTKIPLYENPDWAKGFDVVVSLVSPYKEVRESFKEKMKNNIREIYSIASANKLRELIAKHFIPTQDEKKHNAEVPTPVKLVDQMLDAIPLEFWTNPNKVFEPCCGKGNFVLGIFDRFYKGLEAKYPDEMLRCKVIMTQCIYYADLTALNVFITTELMKCHVQSYCGVVDFDYAFNEYTGDTLKIDITKQWKITGFDAVIGNPPYSTDPSKPDTKSLYDKFIEKYISNKLLLFVVPSRWFIGGKGLDNFRDFMIKRKDIFL
jgi:hypothetical protein